MNNPPPSVVTTWTGAARFGTGDFPTQVSRRQL